MKRYLKKNSAQGFTLIETIIALAIYAILISTLVVVSKTSTDSIAKLEEKVIARRALKNIIIDFRLSKNNESFSIGKFEGKYKMSYFNYQWHIKIERSQNELTKILTAKIYLDNQFNSSNPPSLATISNVL